MQTTLSSLLLLTLLVSPLTAGHPDLTTLAPTPVPLSLTPTIQVIPAPVPVTPIAPAIPVSR